MRRDRQANRRPTESLLTLLGGQHDRQRIAVEVRRHKVAISVAIEVTSGNSVWGISHRKQGRSGKASEGALTIAQIDSDVCTRAVGERKIEEAIPVEIHDRNLTRAIAGGQRDRHREASGSIPEEDRRVPRSLVGDHHIEIFVAIQICNSHSHRTGIGAHGIGVAEGSVAVTKPHAQGLVIEVGDQHVELAITVHVSECQIKRVRSHSDRSRSRCNQGSGAIPDEYVGRSHLIGNHYVQFSVSVHVSDSQSVRARYRYCLCRSKGSGTTVDQDSHAPTAVGHSYVELVVSSEIRVNELLSTVVGSVNSGRLIQAGFA